VLEIGDSGGFGLFSSRWTDEFIAPGSAFFTTVHDGVEAKMKAGPQHVLAHELDHVKGRYHIDGPNQQGGIGAIRRTRLRAGLIDRWKRVPEHSHGCDLVVQASSAF
jgi:hypothetical protein